MKTKKTYLWQVSSHGIKNSILVMSIDPTKSQQENLEAAKSKGYSPNGNDDLTGVVYATTKKEAKELVKEEIIALLESKTMRKIRRA